MSKKCPDCGSLNVEEVFDGEAYCKNCYLHCSVFDLEDATVFDKITASYEELADKFVYCAEPEHFCECADWRSVILGNVSFTTRQAAFAATVEKLKEVEK